MPSEGNNTNTEERRGSFGRTFSKIKDAVRRRSLGGSFKKSTSDDPSATTEVDSSHVQPADTTPNAVSPIEPAGEHLSTENNTMASTAKADADNAVRDDILEVDEDETGEHNVSSGPISSIRTKIASARAKAVFDKYGIKYEEGDKELADGSKRVEKAIRIRIHWQCHECQNSFSGRRTCGKCGHKRCPDCPRAPSKRVREVLGGTAVMDEIEKKADNASEEKDTVVVPIETGKADAAPAPAETETAAAAADTTTSDRAADLENDKNAEVLTGEAAAGAIPEIEAEGVLEKDELAPDGEVDVTQYEYVMQTRPRAGVRLVLRPKSSYVRRTCHECQTHFKPSSRHKCLNCGHDRCSQCPRERAKGEDTEDANAADGGQQMVGTVERVYKKPRQRIRWACHECQTVFIGKAACSKCGHTRCNNCPRTPLARVPGKEPDAEVLASVAAKLKALKVELPDPVVVGPETTPETTAVAG